MSIKPLDDQIYLTIKKAITNRELAPGTKLSEEMLASVLNVSRTPIRSALQRLSYERLINIIPRKGAYVASPTVKEVQEVFEMRILLEEYAIERAFQQLKNTEIYRTLEEIVEEESKSYQENKLDHVLERVRDFHIEIAQLADNQILVQNLEELIVLSNIYITFYSQINEQSPDSPKEHRLILEAIRDGNIDNAKAYLRNHIEAIINRLNFDLIKSSNRSLEEIIYNSFQSQLG